MEKIDVIQNIRPGMEIKVHEKITDGEKSRVAIFKGTVLAVKHGRGVTGTVTVRNSGLAGVGVERIFPLHMPAIEKIDIVKTPTKVRRSKLYYLRTVSRKRARQKIETRDTAN